MQGLKRMALVAITGLTVWTQMAPAADYYVAQQNPAAVDTNPGTADQPWKTISRSLTTLRSGDTLNVRAGVYREMVMLESNGWTFAGITAPRFSGGTSIASPVRFIAHPGEEVVIKGSDVVTGWKPHAGAIWVRENWDYNSQQVFCDGAHLQQIGGVMVPVLQEYWLGEYRDKGFGDLMPGSFFYDRQQKKLFIWLPDSDDPNRHLMEAGARPLLFKIGVDVNCIHVSGFKMQHGDAGSLIGWCAVSINGAFDVLEDCEVSWCDIGGVGLGGHDNIVRRCRINHNGLGGMGGAGWGNQVLDCQIAGNNYRHWNAGWGGGGMKVIPSAHGWIVSGCVAESNRWSDGIWFDSGNANVIIQNCTVRHNDGNGIHYEISERAIIRNNIAYGNKARGIYLSNSSRSIVLHNLCYSNGMSGIVVHGVNRTGGFSTDPETGYEPACDNVVWGNILMDNCHPDLCPRDTDHTGRTWSARPELILPDPRIKSNAGCVSDYNIFYRSVSRPLPFWENWGSVIYTDLRDWQSRAGQDRHSRVVEPRFVNLAEKDFHPASNSPAIQFVRPQMSIHEDRDGRLRMESATFVTAGPYEAPKSLRAMPPGTTNSAPILRAVVLPGASPLPDGDSPLALLAAALRTIPARRTPAGEPGIELNGIPFALGAPPQAIVLDKSHPRVLIPVNVRVKELHFLLAILNPGTGVQSGCTISRQDGVVIPLRWETGRNIAPSIGPWSGILTNELSPPAPGLAKEVPKHLTKVAWEGNSGQAPVRLFSSSWRNLNEWLPVKDIEWVLTDDSATVIILGVTGLVVD